MMEAQDVSSQIEKIDEELQSRVNQLLAADPASRELIGLKRGLEMSLNGSLENGQANTKEDS